MIVNCFSFESLIVVNKGVPLGLLRYVLNVWTPAPAVTKGRAWVAVAPGAKEPVQGSDCSGFASIWYLIVPDVSVEVPVFLISI